jgi:hypothetical protein
MDLPIQLKPIYEIMHINEIAKNYTTNFEGTDDYESCSQSLKPSFSTQIIMTISTNNNDKLPLRPCISNTYIFTPSPTRSSMSLDATNHHNSSQVT